MNDKLKVREYSREEIATRREKRQNRATKGATKFEAVKVPRNRARHKFRYCVSLTPSTAYFLREQFGGPEQSLSAGIEAISKIARTIAKERK